VSAVIVASNGSIASSDDLAVYFSRDGYVLANREAENVLGMGELETVTAILVSHAKNKNSSMDATYTAVLGETLMTFSRGNSFHSLGSSGLVRPAVREGNEVK